MRRSSLNPKIAFVMDERLPHVRKAQFLQFIHRLRAHCTLEIFPVKDGMDAFLKQVGAGHHALILLPWYLYLDWKKVENHFGTLRLHGVTVAGYFADALLPFDLNTMPNYIA